MIPTIPQIVEDLLTGTITKIQAIGWLYQHADGSANELRDAMAMSALQGMLAHDGDGTIGLAAGSAVAYDYADAMMKQRGKQ